MVGKSAWVRKQAEVLANVYCKKPVDVVHWHTPLNEGLIAQESRSTIKVFTNHTSQFLEWSLGKKDPERAKQVLAPADFVICPSQELSEATLATGFDPSRVFVISNGVDPARFAPSSTGIEVRHSLGIGDSDMLVLCPRRLEKKNGVTYWLKSIPLVLAESDCRLKVKFLLIGDYVSNDSYSDRPNVIRTIRDLQLGSEFRWERTVHPNQMPKYMAAADVIVLPSLMEATSIAGLEAMSSGKPLIGTRVGGILEIIEEDLTGILIPPADPQSLAQATLSLLFDRQKQRSMGVAARKRVLRNYSWDVIGKRTFRLYQEMLEIARKS